MDIKKEEAKALELEDLDQVTGGAGLDAQSVVPTPGFGAKEVASGVLKQVVSGVGGVSAQGISDKIEGVQSSDR